MGSFTRLQVLESITPEFHQYLPEKLMAHVFQSEAGLEQCMGWCSYVDPMGDTWDGDDVFVDTSYPRWGFRIDTRRVPSALLKKEVQSVIKQELRKTGAMFISRERKAEIQEQVKLHLLDKALPVPETFKVVWDIEHDFVYINTTSEKKLECFTAFFLDKLGFTLLPYTPYDYARKEFPDREVDIAQYVETDFTGKGKITQDTQQYLATDFLTWLWYRSDTDAVFMPSAALDMITLSVEQNITVEGYENATKDCTTSSGLLSPLSEARYGLKAGKSVVKIQLCLDTVKYGIFKVSLKAKDAGYFAVKLPKIAKEKGEEPDEGADFILKFDFLKTLIEFIDALYHQFITLRLNGEWGKTSAKIKDWIEQF